MYMHHTQVYTGVNTNKISLQNVHKTKYKEMPYSYKHTRDRGIRNPFSIKQSHMMTNLNSGLKIKVERFVVSSAANRSISNGEGGRDEHTIWPMLAYKYEMLCVERSSVSRHTVVYKSWQ